MKNCGTKASFPALSLCQRLKQPLLSPHNKRHKNPIISYRVMEARWLGSPVYVADLSCPSLELHLPELGAKGQNGQLWSWHHSQRNCRSPRNFEMCGQCRRFSLKFWKAEKKMNFVYKPKSKWSPHNIYHTEILNYGPECLYHSTYKYSSSILDNAQVKLQNHLQSSRATLYISIKLSPFNIKERDATTASFAICHGDQRG